MIRRATFDRPPCPSPREIRTIEDIPGCICIRDRLPIEFPSLWRTVGTALADIARYADTAGDGADSRSRSPSIATGSSGLSMQINRTTNFFVISSPVTFWPQ